MRHACLYASLVFALPSAWGQGLAPGLMANHPGALPPLTIAAAEAQAVANSPAVATLEAEIRAARCHCLQVGLPPNPTAGYLASEIGNEGQAGQQGAFLGQTFIRGGKLSRAQGVAAQEVRRLEQRLAVERLRLLTDTRIAFYDCQLGQREVELTGRLRETSARAADISSELFEAREAPLTDKLQAEIENRRAIAAEAQAIARRSAATRRLGALIGSNDPVHRGVAADPKTMVAQLEYGAVLADLLASSPELAERFTEIQKARCEVSYQRSLATPDLNTQLIAQYDDATGDAIAGVQIGGPLVLWNRNQGAIGRAQAELTAAKRRLDRLEQSLEQRLADAFGRYEAAKSQVEALQDDVLPRAEESLELATAGYEAGEIGFLDLLTVQRTYFVASLESLRSLRELNETVQRIRGRLIDAAPSAGVRLN